MIVYYENFGGAIQVTYDFEGERFYDYFSSFYLFKVWLEHEFDCQAVEITDENYKELAEKGLI